MPESLAQLTGLTRLSLERNYVRELPPSLSRLSHLASLWCGAGLGRAGLRREQLWLALRQHRAPVRGAAKPSS